MTIFAQTLIIEAVNLSDLARLVVAAQNRDAVRIANLQCNEKGDRLDTVMTTVNIISHEQIIGVRKTATEAEKFTKVVELPVYVATNRNRHAHRLHILLLRKDFFRLNAELPDFRLG